MRALSVEKVLLVQALWVVEYLPKTAMALAVFDDPFQIYSAGSNIHGQLGVGDRIDRATPNIIRGVIAPFHIALCNDHSLATTVDGEIFSWGHDTQGQLGLIAADGIQTKDGASHEYDVVKPTLISMLSAFKIRTVSTGKEHTIACSWSGSIFVFGRNDLGQLGTGDDRSLDRPFELKKFGFVVSVASGQYHNIALTADGCVFSWGSNQYGQLGLDTAQQLSIGPQPVRVPRQIEMPNIKITSIAAGAYHSFFIDANGNLYAFGRNDNGQLALGDTFARRSPTVISTIKAVKAVFGCLRHTLILNMTGALYTVGNNDGGQLGIGDLIPRHSPSLVQFGPGGPQTWCDTTDQESISEYFIDMICISTAGASNKVSSIACGDYHTLAVMDDGNVYSWGLNDNGQLGIGSADTSGHYLDVPQLMVNLPSGRAIAAAGGGRHSIIRASSQSLVLRDVLPRAVPLTGGRLWVFGLGFSSVADRVLTCIFSRALPNGTRVTTDITAASVFSNLRAQCRSPDHQGLPFEAREALAGEYFVSFAVDGAETTNDTFPIFLQLVCEEGEDCDSYCSTSSYCAPRITSISPLSGPTSGSSRVQIYGFGFDPAVALDVRCIFGGGAWTVGVVKNATHMECNSTAIPKLKSGSTISVGIKVSINGQDYSLPFPFLYYVQPQLSYTSAPSRYESPQYKSLPNVPYGLVYSGGTFVDIHGFYFPAAIVSAGETVCDFGFAQVKAEFVSASRISCRSPPLDASIPLENGRKEVFVTVKLNGQDSAPKSLMVVYYQPPLIQSIFPGSGPLDLRVTVRVTGLGFLRSQWFPLCQFGSWKQYAYIINDTEVICRTPDWAEIALNATANGTLPSWCSSICTTETCHDCGTESLRTNFSFFPNSQDAVSTSSVSFLLFSSPSISDIVPNGAPVTQDKGRRPLTTITVLGQGFNIPGSGSLYVRFLPIGVQNWTRYAFFNSTFYPLISVLSNPLEWSVKATLSFSADNNAFLSVITPVRVFSGESLVDISLNGQDFSVTSALHFLFYDNPILFSMQPDSGAITGGTVVEIGGFGMSAFAGIVQCQFRLASSNGTTLWNGIVPGTVEGSTSIRCIQPPAPYAGLAEVTVSLNGNDFADPLYPFVLYYQPEIATVEPAGGPHVGGTQVALYGSNTFLNGGIQDLNISCAFGDIIVPGSISNSSGQDKISCISPRHKPETVLLQISLNGQDFGGQFFYTYYVQPSINSTIPTGAIPFRSQIDAATITIFGEGFLNYAEKPLCRFDCFPSFATVLDDRMMSCRVPWPSQDWDIFLPMCSSNRQEYSCIASECPSSGCFQRQISQALDVQCIMDTWVEVTLNGYDYSHASVVNFRYYQSLSEFDFSPAGGPVEGGTAIQFVTPDVNGGFQRLNDGSFAVLFGRERTDCETLDTRLLLEDDFDSPFSLNGSLGVKASPNYIFDPQYWVSGDAVTSSFRCGSDVEIGISSAVITGGNVQGFGAKLTSKNSTSNALLFTGGSPNGYGRYTLTRPMDLTRGFRVKLSIARGGQSWPNPCDEPELEDGLQLLEKSVLFHPEAAPPSFGQRRFWTQVEAWNISDVRPGPVLTPVDFEFRARRRPLGTTSTLQDLLRCPRHQPCNSTEAYLMLFQANHGQGAYDVWVVDDISVTAFGGVEKPDQAACKSAAYSSADTVAVQISLNGQQFQSSSKRFVYYKQPLIKAISPSGGLTSGGTVVTITGKGFQAFLDPSSPPQCRLAEAATTATVINNQTMLCVSPGSAASGFATVAVALNGQDFTSDLHAGGTGVSFIYYDNPKLGFIFPISGPSRGGTVVYITGQGFIMLYPQDPYCRFEPIQHPEGAVVVKGRYLNNSLIVCVTPSATSEFTDEEAMIQVVVEISLNGQQYTSAETLYFSYYDEVTITAAEQTKPGNQIVLNGGDPVTVHGKRLRADSEMRCLHKTQDVCDDTNCTAGVYVDSLYMRSDLIYCNAPIFPGQLAGRGIGHSTLLVASNGLDPCPNGIEFAYYTPLKPYVIRDIIIGGSIFFGLAVFFGYLRYKRWKNKNKKLVANPGGTWVRPSINAGIQHQHETSVRKYGTVKYPLFRTSCEELGVLGEGMGLYFQLLKYFAQVFLILSMVSMPAIYINSSGNAYSSQNIIPSASVSTTVGNIGGTANSNAQLVLFSVSSIMIAVSKETAAIMLSMVDAIGCLFFWICMMRWQSFQTRVSVGINEDTVTCSDYSIMVENVPPDATDSEEWKSFFQSLPPLEDQGGKVADITIALNNGRILDLHHERNQLKHLLHVCKAKLYLTQELQYHTKARLLERKLTKLTARMAALRSRKDFKAVTVFVTFEADTTADAVLDEFKGIIARKGTLFRKRYRLRVRRAPEPDVILWENLQHRGIESFVRSSLVFLASALLLAASFIIIIVTSGAKSNLQLVGYPAFCANAPDPTSPSAQQDILWTRYSDGTTTYQAYLKCYCTACNLGCGNKASTEPDFCQAYFDNETRLMVLTIVSVLGVVVINQGIKIILVRLANVEKKHTTNERDASLARNVFTAQFMNTALINLLINADLIYYFKSLTPLGKEGLGVFTGTSRDLDPSWYSTVGSQMILTVLTASLSPNIAELAKWPMALAKQAIMTNRVLTQEQMNKLYEGPVIELSERYGALLSVLFVVMLYSSGIPLLYLFAVLYFSTAYWSDKTVLLMIAKRPGSIDSTLVRQATSLLLWALYLHITFSVWVFGAIGDGATIFVPLVTELYNRGISKLQPGQQLDFVTMVTGRLQCIPALIPFLGLLLLIGRDVLVAFISPAYQFAREWYHVRQRRVERQRLVALRKRAGYDADAAEGEEDEDLKRVEWLGGNPPYSEAVEYEEMVGLTSYKMIKNPKYKEAFDDSEYKEAFDDSEYVATMSDGSGDEDDWDEDRSFGHVSSDDELAPVAGTRRR